MYYLYHFLGSVVEDTQNNFLIPMVTIAKNIVLMDLNAQRILYLAWNKLYRSLIFYFQSIKYWNNFKHPSLTKKEYLKSKIIKWRWRRHFGLFKQSKWQDIIKFILDSTEGKEEGKSLGIDILYIAMEYHAPIALITFLSDVLERENGRKVTLNSMQLRKALYN